VVDMVSKTSVADLLKMSDTQDNAARSRYYVFEVRDGTEILGRFISNKIGSVEKLFQCCPPDTRPNANVFSVYQSPEYSEAEQERGPNYEYVKLWTRKPPRAYVMEVLKVLPDGDFVYTKTGFSAMRKYSYGTFVQMGPHMYTLAQIKAVFHFGAWEDGRVTKRALSLMHVEGVESLDGYEKLDAA
jgi:hypothetical protein